VALHRSVAQLTLCSIYQEYLAKSLTDKYGNLSVQVDKIIHDANSEIDNLNQKLASKW
jgi:E3 ubiquitin-protein ligase CCNP1IP1